MLISSSMYGSTRGPSGSERYLGPLAIGLSALATLAIAIHVGAGSPGAAWLALVTCLANLLAVVGLTARVRRTGAALADEVVARDELTRWINRSLAEAEGERARLEAAAREASEALAAALDLAPEAIVCTTGDGYVTAWNAAAERLFGHRAVEAIGRYYPALDPDWREQTEGIIRLTVAGQPVRDLRTRRRGPDGQLFDLWLSTAPIRPGRETKGVVIAVVRAVVAPEPGPGAGPAAAGTAGQTAGGAPIAGAAGVGDAANRRSILVVEDDAALLRLTTRQLDGLGYRVSQARDAAAALDHLEAGHHCDLLLADMQLPGLMDGAALASAVRRRWPGVRVLLASGLPGAADEEPCGLDGVRLLLKPYRRAELAEAVRDSLSPG